MNRSRYGLLSFRDTCASLHFVHGGQVILNLKLGELN